MKIVLKSIKLLWIAWITFVSTGFIFDRITLNYLVQGIQAHEQYTMAVLINDHDVKVRYYLADMMGYDIPVEKGQPPLHGSFPVYISESELEKYANRWRVYLLSNPQVNKNDK